MPFKELAQNGGRRDPFLTEDCGARRTLCASDKPANRLRDIIENAEAIFRYTSGMDLRAIEEDRKTCDAVERCLERISEAVAKLGDLAPVLMPDSALA